MILFPAIDFFGGKAVRLLRGDYNEMTVYSDDPSSVANDFKKCGATHIHMVDLEGAKSGGNENLGFISEAARVFGGFSEVGGGIRNVETAEKYFSAGISRVILGTAAVRDKAFLETAVKEYGERIAVGVDVREGKVAVNGWTEDTGIDVFDFCSCLYGIGVRTVICTDISRDGAMRGANVGLYRELRQRTGLSVVASGGVSSYEDLKRLEDLGADGAIIGKAYYTGAIDLKKALELYK
ncbi:MAG: 1-(5-phosphoribosyl)-5-[(5-phosphoribosylamino)methylideneamino]imidazole-4-carboxamide isomerase [Clostridia bacterium]|nr:1-(5-phosphoribosyl)-5-[(5-phosphoribosylamino)methylideneamino]imidazole-4-carboxamide isomerase [Clostridia bacterium]